MAQIINTRSPFYIRVSETDLSTATLSIYIYTGDSTLTPPSSYLKYTITKASGIIGSEDIVFEISELVRDYVDIYYDGEYDSQCVWVTAKTEKFEEDGTSLGSHTVSLLGVNGFGYHYEGIKEVASSSDNTIKYIGAEFDEGLMMSNATIYRVSDRSINIPIYKDTANSVSFFNNGDLIRTVTIAKDTIDTDSQIQYIASDGNSEADNYRERVLEAGGVFENNSLLEAFEDSFDIGEVDEVYVNYTVGTEVNEDSQTVTNTATHVLKVKTFDCSKYEPIRVTFVNKFGALQDMYFTKRSNESMNVSTEDYKASLIDFSSSVSYDTSAHQMRTLNLMGKESITLNTDYIDESCNEHIKQLMLSEKVWMTRLTDEEKVVPLKIKSNSLQLKKRVNDKLIQYTMEFDVAADMINNIR